MPTNIYIVEDHPITSQVLQQFFQKTTDWHVAGLVATGQEALAQPIDEIAELVLVDLSLPDMNGIQLVQELQARYPDLPCLILSSYQDAVYISRALKAGARGYTIKDEPLSLIPAMQQVLAGNIYLSDKARYELDAVGELAN